MTVREFVDEHYRHFNAGTVSGAARSLTGFLSEEGNSFSPWQGQ